MYANEIPLAYSGNIDEPATENVRDQPESDDDGQGHTRHGLIPETAQQLPVWWAYNLLIHIAECDDRKLNKSHSLPIIKWNQH